MVGQPKLSIKLLQFLVVGGRLNLVQCLGSPNSPHYRKSDPLRVGLFFFMFKFKVGNDRGRYWRRSLYMA